MHSPPQHPVASPSALDQALRVLVAAVLLFGAAVGALLWATWPTPELPTYEVEVQADDDGLRASMTSLNLQPYPSHPASAMPPLPGALTQRARSL